MNDTSPAPQRRRRRPQTAPPPAPQSAPQAAPPQRRAPRPEELDVILRSTPRTPAVNKRRRKKPFYERIPAPLRFLLLFVLAVALVTGSVAITRSYLAAQEERRRLEAEAAERAQHPLYYEDVIRYYAEQQGVDPALVAAIILCESSFDPQATSRLGARGLMQTMEDTAGWIAEKLDEDGPDYSFDLLYDPVTSIRYGCWYLGYLTRRFDGDPKKIVCAYHAGQGNVDSWLKNPKYSSDGVTLDVIPYENTQLYAGRVLRAVDVYRKYYFPAATPQPEPSAAPGP